LTACRESAPFCSCRADSRALAYATRRYPVMRAHW
jgi:hypothetical protein